MPFLSDLGKLPLTVLDMLPGGDLTKKLADHCDSCPVCQWTRANPDHLVAKVVQLHGQLYPCWQAWERHCGEGT